MKIRFYDSNLVDLGEYKILDRNVIVPKVHKLPDFKEIKKPETYLNFTTDRSDTYKSSIGNKMNVRVSYNSTKGETHIYCRLNYLNWVRLRRLNRESLYDKFPIQVVGTGLSMIGLIVNFSLDFSRSLESSQNEAIPEKIQALEQKIDSIHLQASTQSLVSSDSVFLPIQISRATP